MSEQKHIRVYRKFFKIGDQDVMPLCEMSCGRLCNDIHHIYSRGLPTFVHNGETYDIDDIKNLIGLCRKCHDAAHGGGFTKGQLILRHKYVMLQQQYGYTYK